MDTYPPSPHKISLPHTPHHIIIIITHHLSKPHFIEIYPPSPHKISLSAILHSPRVSPSHTQSLCQNNLQPVLTNFGLGTSCSSPSSQANFLLNLLISNFMPSSSYFAPLLPLFTPPLPFLHPTWSCQLWPSLSPRGGELRWNGQCQSTRLIEIYWFCPACQVNARPRFSCLFLARPS